MTFTYDLTNPDETKALISEVRLEIGDTQLNAGVKPDGTNFSDEEIELWLGKVDNDVNLTVAKACSALSRLWTVVANSTVGPRKEELGKVADAWAARASELESGVDVSASSTYRIRIRKTSHPHDPYEVREADERKL
jgi:hypothetical protein